MNKALKMIISMLLVLSLSIPISAYATEENVVGGGEFAIGYVKSYTFSVNIKNNTGLMGYKMFAEYDDTAIKVVAVNRGTITKGGNFSANFDNAGKIIIVWNDTSQKSSDGSLFDVALEVLKPQKDTEIKLSYSKADTFDEKYKEVLLKPKSIKLKGNAHADIVSTETKESSDKKPKDNPKTKISDEQDYAKIVSELGKILENYDLTNLSPKEISTLLIKAGAAVDKVSGTTGQTFSSLESLKFFYSQAKINAAEQEIKNSGKQKTVDKIVSEKLEKFDVVSFNKLPKEEQEKAVDEIKKAVKSEQNKNFEDLTEQEWLDTVNQTASKREKPKENGTNTKLILIIVVSVLIILGIAVLVMIYIKRRKKNEKD